MPRKQRNFRISVLFAQDKYGSQNLAGFLDMLRYDHCTVESWDIDKDDNLIEVVLNKEGSPFTTARWQSFGINVAELSEFGSFGR